MKYSLDGGAIEVILRRRSPRGEALIEVRDHGVGVAADQLSRLFTRFGGFSNEAGAPGAGLGLYLSQYFITRHGGQIGARAGDDKGATFWFTLPLQQNVDRERSSQDGHKDRRRR
jgi:signal transduction histidine kinase